LNLAHNLMASWAAALWQPEAHRFFDPLSHGGLRVGLGHALLAELLGTLLFQFVGGFAGSAAGNGLALAVTGGSPVGSAVWQWSTHIM
jgi:hypothetical protein